MGLFMTDAYAVVREFTLQPAPTLRSVAHGLHWYIGKEPDNRRVHVALVQASLSGLVRHRGDWKGWVVTARGKELVKQIKEL